MGFFLPAGVGILWIKLCEKFIGWKGNGLTRYLPSIYKKRKDETLPQDRFPPGQMDRILLNAIMKLKHIHITALGSTHIELFGT